MSCSSLGSFSHQSYLRILSLDYASSDQDHGNTRSTSSQCLSTDAGASLAISITECDRCLPLRRPLSITYHQHQYLYISSRMKFAQTPLKRSPQLQFTKRLKSGIRAWRCPTHHRHMGSGEAACVPTQICSTGKPSLHLLAQCCRHQRTRNRNIVVMLPLHRHTGLETVPPEQEEF